MQRPHSETRRHQAEQRRDAIIAAAARLFCEKGYEGTTIRDIAREVGVTEGLIYHYFPGKAELIVECWRTHRWQERILAPIRDAADRPIGQVLRQLIREHLRILYENGTAVRMHVAEMLRDGELAELSKRYNSETHDAVAEYLRKQQAAGNVRSDLNPVIIAGAILGTAISFFAAHGRLPQDAWDALADEMAEQFTRLLLRGLQGQEGSAQQPAKE